MLGKTREDLLDMLLVFFDRGGVDEDVVKVDEGGDVQEIAEDVVHEVLEDGRSIG